MRKKYLLESILFIGYTLFAMSWIGATEFMSEIMLQVKIESLAQASILSSALILAKVVGAFFAVYLMRKVGVYRAVAFSLFMICFSFITPIATGFFSLFVSRFIMGLGGALLLVYFNPVVFTLFTRRELPFINGLNLCAFNLGMVLIAYIQADLVKMFGSWKLALIALSLVSFLLVLIWVIVANISELGSVQNVEQSNQGFNLFDGLKQFYIWHYAFTFAGLISVYFILFTFYQHAGIVSVKEIGVFSLVGTIIGMICSRGLIPHLILIRISALLQFVSLLLLNFSHDLVMIKFFAIMLSLVISLPLPSMVTFIHSRANMTTHQLGVIFSLVYSISYLIAAFAVSLFAKLVDLRHGDFFYAFIFICFINSFYLIGSLFLRDDNT